MQCRQFEQRMNELLDVRQAPEQDQMLLDHARHCATCHEQLEAQMALFTGLALLEVPPVPASFSSAVMARNKGDAVAPAGRSATRRFPYLAVLGGALALTALLLLAVAFPWGILGGGNDPGLAQPNVIPEPAGSTVSGGAKSAVANVSPATTQKPAPANDYQEYRQAIHSLAAQFPDAVERIDEVQQATPGIRPIRTSFSTAIGTLQRTIPSRKKENRPIKPDTGLFRPLTELVA